MTASHPLPLTWAISNWVQVGGVMWVYRCALRLFSLWRRKGSLGVTPPSARLNGCSEGGRKGWLNRIYCTEP